MTGKRNQASGPQGGRGSANAASNGHWLHDEAGPRSYVAPDAGAAGGQDLAARLAEIGEQLALLPDAATRRLHVAAEDGRIVLTGSVGTAEARRRVGAYVVAAAGEVPVENRLEVRPG